jgi:hypothetical protein
MTSLNGLLLGEYIKEVDAGYIVIDQYLLAAEEYEITAEEKVKSWVVGHKFERGLPKANPSQVMTTAHVEFGYELKQVCQVTFLCLFYLLSLSSGIKHHKIYSNVL